MPPASSLAATAELVGPAYCWKRSISFGSARTPGTVAAIGVQDDGVVLQAVDVLLQAYQQRLVQAVLAVAERTRLGLRDVRLGTRRQVPLQSLLFSSHNTCTPARWRMSSRPSWVLAFLSL